MNRLPSRYYKLGMIGLAILLFVSVFFTQQGINRSRGALGLTRLDPLDNAPPVLAFTTVALGGFRGLIANALWIRATELQDQGKYFEMYQLADWITKLQPHFAAVWVVQAWNMSYNISIKFQDPKDRWQWVKRAIDLLRDDGLRFNPQETLIYRELAWHFQHKMGQNLDDANLYYKQVWAEQMAEVLGKGRPDYQELLNPQTAEARQRVQVLRQKYKMDPEFMRQVDQLYGPLEWRLPEAHAIYWAWVGLAKSKKEEQIQLRRIMFHSMQLAFHRGRLIESRYGQFQFGPNLDIVPNVNRVYEDMMEQDPEMAYSIRTGHRNFLRDAVYFLYTNNRLADAQRWFKYVGEKYPDKDLLMQQPGSLPGRITLEEYALGRVQEDIGETSMDRVTAILQGLIYRYYVNLALGFDDEAVNYERMAGKIWNRYMRTIKGSEQRVGLRPLNLIKQDVRDRLLGPESPLDPVSREQLRTTLGLPAATTNAPPVVSSTATNGLPVPTAAP